MTKTRTVSADAAYHETIAAWGLTFFRILFTAAFVFYLCSVLYLVLGERLLYGSASRFHQAAENMAYLEQVKAFIQPVPFRTFLRYAARLPRSNPLRRTAFVNLAGNLALFFPMGIFLPYFCPGQRKFLRFSITVILMICCVEVIQVLTLLGACDIDDLILNYAGAAAGFLCFRILDFLRRKIYGRNL